MKICYVTNYLWGYHSHSGGAEQAILRTANLVSDKVRNNIEIFFLTLPVDKQIDKTITVFPVKVIESFLSPVKKYIEILKWYIFQFDPVSFFISKKIFSETKTDLVHFGNFQFLTFSVLIAAKQLGIPVFVSVYDYWYFCPLTTLFDYKDKTCRNFHGLRCVECLPRNMRLVQKFFLLFRKRIFDFYLKKVDRFIVLSESSKQILLDYRIEKDKISVVRLPIADDFKKPEIDQEPKKNSVLFIGWLQKRKGLHILLDAMSILWEKMPDIKLTIVVQKVKWEKDYEKLIDSKLKKIPKNKYIFLSRQMKPEEIKSLIQKTNVVVVPEQWENMSPLIVIEVMLMSKPVVASRIGGIPEFIEHNKEGLLVEHNSPEDFAEKILYLLDDQQKGEIFGRNAYQKILKLLDKKYISEKYLENIENILQRGKGFNS